MALNKQSDFRYRIRLDLVEESKNQTNCQLGATESCHTDPFGDEKKQYRYSYDKETKKFKIVCRNRVDHIGLFVPYNCSTVPIPEYLFHNAYLQPVQKTPEGLWEFEWSHVPFETVVLCHSEFIPTQSETKLALLQ